MPERYARIFLLSHMRAATSLAGHILGSHPRINGYFEMHISYDTAVALDRQFALLRRHERLKPGSHYLFDKLLHNDYRLAPGRFGDTPVRLLVSLAEPGHTIRSIVHLFRGKGRPEEYAEPAAATRYYIERVEALAAFCASVGQPYYYYDAERLRSAPEQLLASLSAWLDLDTPLGPRYRIFSQTGKSGRGDSSAAILSGRIEARRGDYGHISLPPALLAQAREAYRHCRARILARAGERCLLTPADVY